MATIKYISGRLGRNIKSARLKAGLTQLELAHAIGYKGDDAGAYICRVEAGKQEPRLPVLTRIAGELKTDLGLLLQ